ncbi:hypothetical protein Pth03_24610 [Planotetraspora thailandica]|uniref:Uncharacterized protein n=1 Tax=Planotetraspora thailandica TaxID=487172 RepID=A0A8J3V220_9ACTN|nr:hypothetical protein [Planotetraspora thailandica]GII54072.1 hypothetical protein Pth03_24610 [Planotetraspora thailandica]
MRAYVRNILVAALICAGLAAGAAAVAPDAHNEAAESPYISCC